MSWFRAHRRCIVAFAALAVMSLALVRYVCPWPIGVFDVSPQATQSSSSAMSPDRFCGPEGCTYAHGSHAAPAQTLLTVLPAPLLIAAFFLAVGAVRLAPAATRHRRTFHRLPGYPPILEFYRLRI